ncbi:MAG: hypothetical protein ACFB6R_14540 [Alphaproteobacteria bacterium]
MTDSRFFGGAGLVLALVVFLGFSETFYLRSADLGPVPTLFMVHGVIYSAWFLLFPVQVWLIAARRWRTHRAFGMGAMGLAVGMVVTGLMAGFDALERGVEIPGAGAAAFFFLSFSDAVGFAVLFAAALAARRLGPWHKRLMLIASASVILPAAVRMAGMIGFPEAGAGVQLGLLGALGLYDIYRLGQPHMATAIGGVFLGLKLLGVLSLARTDAWAGFVAWLAG